MLIILILLFTVIPVLELWLLIRIGTLIGAEITIGIVLVTGIIGGVLVKQQGLSIISKIKSQLSSGEFPGDAILEGVILLAGGLLLITPGFLTDLTGFLIVIPYTRKIFVNILKRFL
ncbi:FxsA family protein, partial [bacterium]|nr:FxsA family protein [bacterium]